MIVKALSSVGDRNPTVRHASIVLIEDRNGTLVGVAVSMPDDMGVIVAHADDPDFNTIVSELGIRDFTVVTDFHHTPIEDLAARKPIA